MLASLLRVVVDEFLDVGLDEPDPGEELLGRLSTVVDPRSGLGTTYGYDSGDRPPSVKPAGLTAYQLSYTTAPDVKLAGMGVTPAYSPGRRATGTPPRPGPARRAPSVPPDRTHRGAGPRRTGR